MVSLGKHEHADIRRLPSIHHIQLRAVPLSFATLRGVRDPSTQVHRDLLWYSLDHSLYLVLIQPCCDFAYAFTGVIARGEGRPK